MDKDKGKLNTAPSQTQKIQCQYCPADAKPILVKNYKRHIESHHKDKDSRNLKDRKTKSITFWTSSSKRKRDSSSESEIESQTIKRRHQSGDSGCGTGDDDDDDNKVFETGDRGLDSHRQEEGESHESATVTVETGQKETTVWREKEPDEEDTSTADETDECPGPLLVHDPVATLSDVNETDKSHDPLLVHDPAATLSEETEQSQGLLPVHDPAATLSDGEDDREIETSNNDLLNMLCQLKLGQNQVQLKLSRIQEGVDKISLKPGPDTEESRGPLLVHDPVATLSEEVSAHFSVVKSIKAFEKLDFSFDDEKEVLCCNICDTTFKYTGQHEFKDEILSAEFRNLKKHVKTHLLSQRHRSIVAERQQEKERKKAFMSRNRRAGFNLGRIVYKNVALRQAKRDYEIDVLLTSRAGGEVGNINHSSTFVLNLRPFLADAVRGKKRAFLSTPTVQTGCLICLSFHADGATYQRECRHFQGIEYYLINCDLNSDTDN